MLDAKVVSVNDPYVGRRYQARLAVRRTQTQNGVPGKHYVAELREIDKIDAFERLEIDGVEYTVLKYNETLTTEKFVERHALLRLNPDEYLTLRRLATGDQETVQVRRVGIDADPLILEVSGLSLWSEHEQDDEVYYKYIIEFRVPEFVTRKPNVWSALGIVMRNSTRLAISARARFEALLDDLVQGGVITQERREMLLNSPLDDLIGETGVTDLWMMRTENRRC